MQAELDDNGIRTNGSGTGAAGTGTAVLAERVEALSDALDRLQAILAQGMSINSSEFAALGHLRRSHHLTPKELAEVLGVATSSVTYVVDRLESAGLIARMPHPDDRRSLLVELTETGADQIATAYGYYFRAVDSALAVSGIRRADEVATFVAAVTEQLLLATATLVEAEHADS